MSTTSREIFQAPAPGQPPREFGTMCPNSAHDDVGKLAAAKKPRKKRLRMKSRRNARHFAANVDDAVPGCHHPLRRGRKKTARPPLHAPPERPNCAKSGPPRRRAATARRR